VDERERVARFYVDAWRRRAAACRGEVHEVGRLVVCLTGAPAPWFNATLVVEDGPGVDDDLLAARGVYPPGLGFGIEVLPELQPSARRAVEAVGFHVIDGSPVMNLDIDALVAPPPPDGVEVLEITDPAGLDAVAATDAAGFGGDAGVTRRFLADGVLDDPTQRVYAAMSDREMVGAGETSLADGVLGVFGVTTVPAARRRGIGAALTAHMIAERSDEADLATLDASELGRGVYERLGFRTVTTREVWGPPTEPV